MQRYANLAFDHPREVLEAFDKRGLVDAFKRIEQAWETYTLLGYIRYEAKRALLEPDYVSRDPLLYFEVHESSVPYTPLPQPDQPLLVTPAIDYTAYRHALRRIKEEIASGNTYQVNFTYDMVVQTSLPPLELYEMLLPRHTTPYSAFIQNRYESLLSFSPELFFEINGRQIRAKPMKGTARRGRDQGEDDAHRQFLLDDEKNRSENVMIVDLLRNDLGRVARPGSVKVTKLFEVETHKTVHQMTSEIVAELSEHASLWEIVQALFPCGSVTGAPKRSTMMIIDAVEQGPRDIYCGAIGFLQPGRATFSVPIRMLQRRHDETHYRYRVGSGIVWDSDPQDEWLETQTKAAFLHGELQLLETVRIKDGKPLFWEEHLARMAHSARELGFAFQPPPLQITEGYSDSILRLLLSRDGTVTPEFQAYDEIRTTRVHLARARIASFEPLLRHKTTYRPWYALTLRKIKQGLLYDELFVNEHGELTEGARSNLFLQLGGTLCTPPLACGLLNGLLRQKLLADGACVERRLYPKDLERAEQVYCGNSVRGLVEVQLDSPASDNR